MTTSEMQGEFIEYGKFALFLKEKFKLDFTNYAISSFKRRIDRIVELYSLNSIDHLVEKLEADTFFIEKLIEEITVNTTEMFRDPTVWLSIRNEVFPTLSSHDSIRIWHAGCSSGEEVFSMAILLTELGLYEKAKIYASDLDQTIMKKAQNGIYSAKMIDVHSENYYKSGGQKKFNDYYSIDEDGKMVMNLNLLRNVTFKKHDLVTGIPFSKFDIILCRNVMIYFNKTLQDNVIENFLKSIFKDGLFVIGNKETLSLSTHYSKFSNFNEKEKIYQLKR